MAKRLQHRGGTTSQHSSFTGAVREVTVDTDKNTLVVHDGATAGGHPLATATNFTSTGIDDNATSTAITIDSSENVGIGTSSPERTLDVSGDMRISDTGANTGLRITVDTNREAYLVFGDTDDSSMAGIAYDNSTNALTFDANNAEVMRINSTGNVTIGTTTAQAKLHIVKTDVGALSNSNADDLMLEDTNAGLTIGSSTTGEGAIHFSDSGDADVGKIQYAHSSNLMTFRTNGANRMFIDSSGHLLVGSSSSAGGNNGSALQVKGTLDSTDSNIGLMNSIDQLAGRFHLNSSGSNSVSIGADPDDVAGGSSLIFEVDGSERMRIDSSGNVGIGTSSPAAQLHIYNSSGTSGFRLTRGNNITGVGMHMVTDSAQNYFNAYGNLAFGCSATGTGTGASERMRITSSGNVGIGTSSPTAKLNVNGAIVGATKADSTPDNTDVSGVNSLTVSTGAANLTINGLVGGVQGQVLHIIKTNSANTLTITHNNAGGTQKIFTSDTNSISLTNFGGVTLLFFNGNWYEVGK